MYVFLLLSAPFLCLTAQCVDGSPSGPCYRCAAAPNSTICTACLNGMHLINGVCVDSNNANYTFCTPDTTAGYVVCSACTGAFYLDPAFSGCFSCHSSCKTCVGPSHFDCITCIVGELESPAPSACPCSTTLTNCRECAPKDAVGYCRVCEANYLPIEGKCVDSSDATYKYCVSDIYHPTSCSSCTGPYYYDANIYSCFSCHDTCLTCSGPTANACLTCPTGGLSVNGACPVPVCTIGSADNTVYHCTTCEAGKVNCSSCATGYYLATVRKYKLCRPCNPLCKACIDEDGDKCTECAVGSVDANMMCAAPTCTIVDGKMTGTNQNCRTCSSDKVNCLECVEGYFLQRVGIYNVCTKCHVTCYTCFGPSTNECLLCASYVSADGSCTDPVCQIGSSSHNNYNCATCNSDKKSCEVCAENYFLVTRGLIKVCERCDNIDNCITCDTTGKKCTECRDGYRLVQGVCKECPVLEGCLTCADDLAKCKKCKELYYLSDNGTCARCYKTCLTCTGPEESKCSSCITTKKAAGSCSEPICSPEIGCTICENSNSCRVCKEEGYYKLNLIDYSICKPCDKSCFSCNGPTASDCLACPIGTPKLGICATPSCENRNTDTNVNCKVCDSKKVNCTTCLDGYFQVTRAGIRTCSACHGSCKKCYSAGEGHCTACVNPDSSVSDSRPGTCLVPVCKPNSDGCLKCTSDGTSCSVCNVGYYLAKVGFYTVCNKCPDSHKCLTCSQLWWCSESVLCDNCPEGMVRKDDCTCTEDTTNNLKTCPSDDQYKNCSRCDTSSSSSSSTSTCTVCKTGYYNGDNKLCEEKCPRGCIACTSETFCTACYTGAYTGFYGMPCVSACTANEALVLGTTAIDDRCVACHPACIGCTGPKEEDCIACSLSTYKSDKPGCHICHPKCKTCSGATERNCLSCNTGYYMLNGICELKEKCLESKANYISDNICRMCMQTISGCIECEKNASDVLVCLRCGSDYVAKTRDGVITSCVSRQIRKSSAIGIGISVASLLLLGVGLTIFFVSRRFSSR